MDMPRRSRSPRSAPPTADRPPEPAAADDGRRETPAERSDRNWNELLQELRVTQTGVQILTGFLLTLPFQERFEDLDDHQRTLYLILVALAVLTTGSSRRPSACTGSCSASASSARPSRRATGSPAPACSPCR
jgi:hypothetical protein